MSQYINSICSLALLLAVGCIPNIGDQGEVPISTVALPRSPYTLCLYGPSVDGSYLYIIFSDDFSKSSDSYSLGNTNVSIKNTIPVIAEEADGVYRIAWGVDKDAAFVVVDVGRDEIVEDSNAATAKRLPFRCKY
jgi:hypothetical protein